jgi:hypothetical protein
MLSMKARRRREARGRGRGRSRRPGRWVRRVRILGGRRGCAGSSPWTSFSARAAAASGGSWGPTGGERRRVLLERLGCGIASPSAEPSRPPPRRGASPNTPLVPAFPRRIRTSRRRLPPVFLRALAAPDFISTRARFSTDRRPSEHRRGSSPFPGPWTSPWGARSWRASRGQGGKVGSSERALEFLRSRPADAGAEAPYNSSFRVAGYLAPRWGAGQWAARWLHNRSVGGPTMTTRLIIDDVVKV